MIPRVAPRLALTLLLAVSLSLPAAAQNAVQLENQKQGTADWEAFPEASNREIEGYASLTSVDRGGTINFYVNTAEPSYALEIFRLGWYNGLGARRVLGPVTRPGVVQTTPAPDANGMVECNWTAPYTLTIPNSSDVTDWASGVYVVRLTGSQSNKKRFIFFVVRDDARASNHYFISAVNTSQAYNNWGGKSLYTFNSTNAVAATKISLNRPLANGAGTGDFIFRWEYDMLRFLEREGYDVTYGTDVDLHERGNLLLNHRDVLIVGHSEYWSYAMRQNVEAARDQGVNLGFFAGNSVYWQIRYEPSPVSGFADRTIVGYKETALTKDPYATDKDSTNNKYITTSWRSSTLNDSEDALVGTLYFYDDTNCCGDITIDDVTSAPWVFANTG
ncbi:MAG TPA: N,N-dimethylformamidase beta subunit family domain-containing protein, partial [Thermoanaerobaculia bacterium]|nr:N,N-dimethylformamidase beta subunit family domain-containing protein [Thermoanaerobaculia bacterium]